MAFAFLLARALPTCQFRLSHSGGLESSNQSLVSGQSCSAGGLDSLQEKSKNEREVYAVNMAVRFAKKDKKGE